VIRIGAKFGRWVVVGPAEPEPRHGARWLCRCQCGAVRVIRSDNLRSKSSRSCGCLRRDLISARNVELARDAMSAPSA
jgi:hypothetical protein